MISAIMLHIEFKLEGRTHDVPWSRDEHAAIDHARSALFAGRAEAAVIRDDEDGRVVWEGEAPEA